MIRRGDEGFVTPFAVCFTLALIMVVGLVLDGGYILAARRRAMDEAEGAARAGAQSVAASSRAGPIALDPQRARASVEDYLRPTGHVAQVIVSGDLVSVTVSFTQRPLILGVAGLATVHVSGTARARAVPGIERAGG